MRDDGSLNDKFPGGVEAQAARLEEEGHIIQVAIGKKMPKVKDFEKYLIKLWVAQKPWGYKSSRNGYITKPVGSLG